MAVSTRKNPKLSEKGKELQKVKKAVVAKTLKKSKKSLETGESLGLPVKSSAAPVREQSYGMSQLADDMGDMHMGGRRKRKSKKSKKTRRSHN